MNQSNVILPRLKAGVKSARECRRIGRAESQRKVQIVRGTGHAPRCHGKTSNQRILIQEMLATGVSGNRLRSNRWVGWV